MPSRLNAGRFAPSPSGPLHLGSAVAALLSYLAARTSGRRWYVRIDDIDPPRESPGATEAILRSLEGMGLEWDGSVLYQSARHGAYRAAAQALADHGRAFWCTCSRQQIRAHPGSGAQGTRYPGTCRAGAGTGERALRVRVPPAGVITQFEDLWQGEQRVDLDAACGDYVIWRKDGLPAYHLANVVDDAYLGIDFVARGVDLLDSAAIHRHLHEQLQTDGPAPDYGHFPVVVDDRGIKLSKRTGARPFPAEKAGLCLFLLLDWMGANPPRELARAPIRTVLPWAIRNWRPENLVDTQEIPLSALVRALEMN